VDWAASGPVQVIALNRGVLDARLPERQMRTQSRTERTEIGATGPCEGTRSGQRLSGLNPRTGFGGGRSAVRLSRVRVSSHSGANEPSQCSYTSASGPGSSV